MSRKFKILSLDGGGIRGIFPAMLLTKFEEELKSRGEQNWQIFQNFDLICGTSTGGILSIGLSLGIPAKELYKLYLENAELIFGNKMCILRNLIRSAHKRESLETLVRETFLKYSVSDSGKDPRLLDCKTNVLIPIYDLMEGRPSVLKNKYHPAMVRDYHIPAYVAAMATSAAPTYFDPYSTEFTDLNGLETPFHNKVDGGVFANNPTLNALVEAQKAFSLDLKDISILSIGTGHQKFCDAGLTKKKKTRKKYGIHYWMTQGGKKRLIELFMQGQSQQTQNLISLLKNGIDRREEDNFDYMRINTELDETCSIDLDETDHSKLSKLAEKAIIEFQTNATQLIKSFSGGRSNISVQNEV